MSKTFAASGDCSKIKLLEQRSRKTRSYLLEGFGTSHRYMIKNVGCVKFKTANVSWCVRQKGENGICSVFISAFSIADLYDLGRSFRQTVGLFISTPRNSKVSWRRSWVCATPKRKSGLQVHNCCVSYPTPVFQVKNYHLVGSGTKPNIEPTNVGGA